MMKIGEPPIPLFYWSEIKFTFRDRENYGDLLSKYVVEKLSGRNVKWVHPKKQPWYRGNKKNFLAIGSIIHHSDNNSVVWGSGIIDQVQNVSPADFRAVRGPQTRRYLNDIGLDCPEVYGDPALLLPRLFSPRVTKKYRFGIVPHYHDYKEVSCHYKDEKDVLVIDVMTLEPEEVTSLLLQCEKIVSSSLHGMIVSHAFGVPSVWVKFSDKLFGNGIKFRDYLESVNLSVYEAEMLKEKLSKNQLEDLFRRHPSIPDRKIINERQNELLFSCPFL